MTRKAYNDSKHEKKLDLKLDLSFFHTMYKIYGASKGTFWFVKLYELQNNWPLMLLFCVKLTSQVSQP